MWMWKRPRSIVVLPYTMPINVFRFLRNDCRLRPRRGSSALDKRLPDELEFCALLVLLFWATSTFYHCYTGNDRYKLLRWYGHPRWYQSNQWLLQGTHIPRAAHLLSVTFYCQQRSDRVFTVMLFISMTMPYDWANYSRPFQFLRFETQILDDENMI